MFFEIMGTIPPLEKVLEQKPELIILTVSKAELEARQYEHIFSVIELLQQAPKAFYNILTFRFVGFERRVESKTQEVEPLYKEPVISRMFLQLYQKYPNVFYFLCLDTNTGYYAFSSLVDVEKGLSDEEIIEQIGVSIHQNTERYVREIGGDCAHTLERLLSNRVDELEEEVFDYEATAFWCSFKECCDKDGSIALPEKLISGALSEIREKVPAEKGRYFIVSDNTLVNNLFMLPPNAMRTDEECPCCGKTGWVIYKPQQDIAPKEQFIWIPDSSYYFIRNMNIASFGYTPIPFVINSDLLICAHCKSSYHISCSDKESFYKLIPNKKILFEDR